MNDKIEFNELENAQKTQIEVQAELLKQKEILKHELELDNKKHMDAIMTNMSKSQMYELDTHRVEPPNAQYQNNIKQALTKGKEKLMMIILMLIIVLLAVGVTPSGGWYEALQTSYVETLVDIFKVGMIGFGVWLTYKLFKK